MFFPVLFFMFNQFLYVYPGFIRFVFIQVSFFYIYPGFIS